MSICVFALILSATSVMAAPVSVPVRAGIHDRFNRVVLDWPVQVKYTMSQGDGVVKIQFDQAANLGLGGFRAAGPPFIQNLSYNNNAKGLELSFRIPDKSRVQAFWSGKSVAFDVLLMTPEKPSFKDQAKTPAKPEPKPEAKADPKPQEPQAKEPEKKAEEKQAAPPVEATTSGPQKPEALPPQPTPKDSAGKAPAPQNPFSGIETLADRMNREAAEKAGTTQPQDTAAKDDDDDADTDNTVIAFRSITKMSAAVFTRAGRLWVVFDQSPANLKPDISGDLADSLKGSTQQTSGASTAFIFNLPQDADPKGISVKQDGLNWVVTLADAGNFVQSLSHVTLSSDDAKTLSLLTGQASNVFTFKDDLLGDKIWVIPVRMPMINSVTVQELPAVTLLPTIVGALLLPQQDGLTVRTDGNQVFVENLTGNMLMSALVDRTRAQQQPQQKKLFMLDVASVPPNVKGMEDQRKYIEHRISKSRDKADKALQALELARVYLREGYGSESEGALNMATGYVPNLSQTPAFLALQGMAQALSGKSKDALATLDRPELEDLPVTDIWRAYAYAQDKDWERAFLAFRSQQKAITEYPPAVVVRLSLAAAESAVATDNFVDAQHFLRPIQQRGTRLNSGQQAARDYMQAKTWLNGADDNKEAAQALLQTLSDGTDRYYRVKAAIDLTAIKLDKKEIKVEDAINMLEKLRFAWRGDRQETMILQSLGHYYLEGKNPMQAMTMWQQAYALAQNDADKKALDKTLHKEFDRLFVEGESKGMAPLQALSLYQRFRDLMPQDEDGAKAGMQLADQLVSVDLLDEAGTLLQEQIDKKSAPDQMLAMGTKLAVIRLLARNPEGAIKALDASEQADVVPDDMEKRRMLLRARAMADMQQVDQALALLANPSIPEGLSLRADIYWRLSRWSDAAYDLQGLIDDVSDKTVKNQTYTNLILRLAIVKAMQNDQMGLNQLSAQYGEMMATSKQGKAFQIMTSQLGDTTLSDLETLKSQVADAELFEKFLQDF